MSKPLDSYDLKDWKADSLGSWQLAISELAKRVTQPSVYRNRDGIEPSKVYGSKNPSMAIANEWRPWCKKEGKRCYSLTACDALGDCRVRNLG